MILKMHRESLFNFVIRGNMHRGIRTNAMNKQASISTSFLNKVKTELA